MARRGRPLVRRGAQPPADDGVRTFRAGDVVVSERGAGGALLLVHAGGSTGSVWDGVAALLADRFRVLVYDRPTYRVRLPPRGAEAMAAEVADLLAVAGAVGGPLLVVGHSSGAVVALQAALTAPASFAGLVLYEPPVAVDRPLGGAALVRARAALDRGDPHEAMVVHARDIAGRLGVLVFRYLPFVGRSLVAHAAGQVADDEALESLGVGVDRYRRLDVPVLLLGGERSPARLRTALDALAAVLPRVDSVVVLPRQGHVATLRAPAAVAEVVASFAGRLLG